MNLYRMSMLISFIAIPVALIMYYGVVDENADFFKKGRGVANQYETVYHKKVYHFGVMVSDPAAIAVISIVFGFISLLVHVGIMEWRTTGMAIKNER